MTRRLAVLVATLSLAATGLLAVPSFASAGPARCPGPGYPPVPHATILVSTTTPLLNATVEVSGTAFCADETVTLTLQGTVVGTAHTDAAGNFDPPVKITKSGSSLQLCGVGASGLAGDRDCVTLNTNASSASGTSGTSAGGGGTALTGTDIALLCLLAAVLLAGGGAAVVAGRRRRHEPVG